VIKDRGVGGKWQIIGGIASPQTPLLEERGFSPLSLRA